MSQSYSLPPASPTPPHLSTHWAGLIDKNHCLTPLGWSGNFWVDVNIRVGLPDRIHSKLSTFGNALESITYRKVIERDMEYWSELQYQVTSQTRSAWSLRGIIKCVHSCIPWCVHSCVYLCVFIIPESSVYPWDSPGKTGKRFRQVERETWRIDLSDECLFES